MRFSPRNGLRLMSRRMSLAVKLPLLMSIVLAAVLGIALVATYTTLQRMALSRATEQLARATRQLATLGAATVPTQHARFLAVANDSAIRRALAAPLTGRRARAAARALRRLSLPTDSGLPLELWSVDSRRVAFIGNDVRSSMRVEPGRPELDERIAMVDSATSPTVDSLRIGPLYADSGRVSFWYVMPIRDRGRTLGYLTQQRRLALGSNANRTLRELSGDSVSLYYRNADGGFWASVTGVPFGGLTQIDTLGGTARDSVGDRLLYHEEHIASTPLIVGMTVPRRNVLARARRTADTILLLSLAIMLAGVVAAAAIGRSVARPLGQITRAASALAAGDFSARAPDTGDFEVRRLGASFNHMAEEIGASRAALERQTREAQAANNAKSEFLTTMSHELRTPLNAIGGYVDLLDLELRGPLTAEQRRDLQRIKASQQHLLGLISSVLDLSRIEAGQVAYSMANVAVDPFLAGLDALVAPQASTKSVTLEHKPAARDLAVVADREKLRQVLLNLLSNAIRHTPPGGTVTLSAEPRGARVAIIVADTGPGIPAEKREMIFEPFVQLDRSLSQTREGLGLGLAISRDLARGMAGDLIVENHDGTGARFVLTLHLGQVDPANGEEFTGELPAHRDTP
jgi:signal transduction histidine kinase